MLKKSLFLLFAVISLSLTLSAQTERSIGLSASVQEGQFGLSIPIRVSPKFVLAPAFDLLYVQNSGTDLSIGIEPRYYLKTEKLSPYLGIKGGAIVNFPSSDNKVVTEKKVDLVGGLAFGGEYFLSDQFSIGVEAQANLTKSADGSERFGNPGGVNFNTATALFATIYF